MDGHSPPSPTPYGDMRKRVHAFDWSRTPLGPLNRWPRTLRLAVDLMLAQPLPMIVLWGPDLTQIYNDGWAAIAKAKHPGALGQANHECWPELRSYNEPIYQRVLSRGEPVLVTDQLIPLDRNGDGRLEDAWFTVSYSPVHDDDGRVQGIFVAVVETTAKILDARDRERRLAEEQLRRGYETFYNLIQNDPFGVYVVDADFRLAHVSLGAQKVFQNVRPLIGRDFAEVLRTVWPEPFASEAIALFRHTLDTGEPYVAQRTVERRNDIPDVEAYDWRIERIGLPDGRPGVVCYFYDLSERQAYEAALRAADERANFLARAIDSSTVPFAAGRPDGSLMVLNPAFCALTGYTEQELRTISWRDQLTPPEWHEAEERILRRVRETGEPALYEKEYVRKDGTRVPIEVNVHLVRDAAGRPLHYYAFVIDVSARKAAEAALRRAKEEAEHANRSKDQFLAALSHELRTPLTPVVLSVAGLETEPGMPPHVREELAMIRQNLALETRLIDDLLDVSRVAGGKMRLHPQPLAVHPLLRAVGDLLGSEFRDKRVELRWELGATRDATVADSARLHQVFWNLLRNAVKFTPAGGRVTVRTANPTARALRVEVEDTGVGIEPAALPRLFHPFEQGGEDVTRQFGGLGLGLAISKAVVDMHGGTIAASSPGRGRGSRFTVELETAGAVASAADAAGGGASRHEAGAAANLRVLLVEDNGPTLRTLRRLLERSGHVVAPAASVAEAVAHVDGREFDVLVSDIGLPDGTGLDLMRQLRERGCAVPGIAITGYGMEEDVRNSLRAGFTAHLTKPVDLMELDLLIRRVAAGEDARDAMNAD